MVSVALRTLHMSTYDTRLTRKIALKSLSFFRSGHETSASSTDSAPNVNTEFPGASGELTDSSLETLTAEKSK